MKIRWILFFGFVVSPATSWKFKEYPYADMTIEQKIAHDGYPLKLYKIKTEDNYILTTYRIPHGKRNLNITKRSPVLLIHGMSACPDMFILQGENRSLGYNLADAGFDVWLLNSRGVRQSQGHKYYNLNKDAKYWNFSFHELGIYDIPANVDLILNETKQKPFAIGHSQGNTAYFVMLAERPEYNEKVKIGVAYAPSVRIFYYNDNPVIGLGLYLYDVFRALYQMLGFNELVPYNRSLTKFLGNICKEQTFMLECCVHFTALVGSTYSKILKRELVPVIIGSTVHSRLAAQQIFHFMQITKTNHFGRFDYGAKRNMQIYGNVTPPQYNLNEVTSPIAIFYASKDAIVTLEGAKEIIEELPNVIFTELVPYKYFNHIDFLFGHNASELVYERTIELFRKFDQKYPN